MKNPVRVGNPEVAITTPQNGPTITGGNTIISASAADKVAINKTELYVDGALVATPSTSSVSYHWNTKGVASGAHSLSAKTFDVSGMSASTSITVYK